MDMLWELRKEQDAECARPGDKWQDFDRLFIKWDGSPMHNNTPYFWFKEFCEKKGIRFCDIHSLRHQYVKYTTKNFSDFFEKFCRFSVSNPYIPHLQ